MRNRLISMLPDWLSLSWFIPDASFVWIFALLIGYVLSIYYVRKGGLDSTIMVKAGGWCIIGGLWGGHIIEVLASPGAIYQNSLSLFRFVQGGKAIMGSLIGGSLLGWLYLRWRKTSILDYADAVMPAIALGYAIGRVGCFLNGCCFGRLGNFFGAIKFPNDTLAFYDHWTRGWVGPDHVLSLAVHPTQLYHAVAGLILFLILKNWQGRWPGSHVILGLASYGSLRFSLQFVRGDRTPILGFLDINQIFSLLFLLIAGLLWWRLGRQHRTRRHVMPALPSADTMQPERL